jgi:protocatechuate 3,4-dioxygenase beta subunit
MRKARHSATWRRLDGAVSRRDIVTGIGALGLLQPLRLAAQPASSCVLTIDSGEGPFYFDPELVRSEIVDGHPGAPLALDIEVVSTDGCSVLEDARVDIWQADGVGLYSGYNRQSGVGGGIDTDQRGETFLRGTQFTGADGRVAFRTIFPSWYGGRTPHVHFKVFVSENELVAGQVFFADEVTRDVFANWDPYRAYADRRTTFNSNDMFMEDGVLQGVLAEVERDTSGYLARARFAVSDA